jgi:hypothetical protein
MRSNLILFVLVLVNQNFIGTRTITKSVLCNRVWNFMKMALDFMKFHMRCQAVEVLNPDT